MLIPAIKSVFQAVPAEEQVKVYDDASVIKVQACARGWLARRQFLSNVSHQECFELSVKALSDEEMPQALAGETDVFCL